MTTNWHLLAFGAVTVDDLIYVDHHPPPGGKMPVQDMLRQGGGLAGTALVAAARLGSSTAYCGVLGDDELSRYTQRELELEGVDCTPVLHDAEARVIHSVIIVDRSTAERTILFSMAGVKEPRPEDITPDLLSQCRVVFIDHTMVETGSHIVDLAQALSIPVVGDIEAVRDPRVEELVHRIDHLIVGTELAGQVTGEQDPGSMVRALSGAERACCVVTAGGEGSWYSERGAEVVHVPAFDVAVVDTTGCGDVFHGAYAACLAWGQGVHRAVLVATAAAGLKATQPGGRQGIPDYPTVQRFLSERGHDHA
jgi:sugar/nucleoside kinase (ribokinase family)